MADDALVRGREKTAKWYADSVIDVHRSADEIRQLLTVDIR